MSDTSDSHNLADAARILDEARKQIDSGQNTQNRNPNVLKDTKLDESTMLDKSGIPVKETDQNNSGINVSE